jgi:hypothetical protein
MTFPDLSFIQTARELETEAVEGGRALSEFTFDSGESGSDEEAQILGRSVDDVEETTERVRALQEYISHVRMAFHQRGLVYPFDVSSSGDSLEILPGFKDPAHRVAQLSSIVGQAIPAAKDFESRAFKALQKVFGGWGVCVGAPRQSGEGPEKSIRKFRELLQGWETGPNWPAHYASSGDNGADGFILIGRSSGGPIVFFQSKNSSFSLKNFPEELARMSDILDDWFGRRMDHHRVIIPVCAFNTVLTLQLKERIVEARGSMACHLVDAVDIVCAELGAEGHPLRLGECKVM